MLSLIVSLSSSQITHILIMLISNQGGTAYSVHVGNVYCQLNWCMQYYIILTVLCIAIKI